MIGTQSFISPVNGLDRLHLLSFKMTGKHIVLGILRVLDLFTSEQLGIQKTTSHIQTYSICIAIFWKIQVPDTLPSLGLEVWEEGIPVVSRTET